MEEHELKNQLGFPRPKIEKIQDYKNIKKIWFSSKEDGKWPDYYEFHAYYKGKSWQSRSN